MLLVVALVFVGVCRTTLGTFPGQLCDTELPDDLVLKNEDLPPLPPFLTHLTPFPPPLPPGTPFPPSRFPCCYPSICFVLVGSQWRTVLSLNSFHLCQSSEPSWLHTASNAYDV